MDIKEFAILLGRIVTILPLLLVMTIFMGKRAIGELPIFDFLIILTLGAVVGADLADPNIKHIPTALTVIVIAILHRIVSKLKISKRTFGRLITFEPTVVIQDGKLLYDNIKSIRYSIDNILRMLRQKNIFDLSEVETAIIEANGTLSVLKRAEKSPVTREDLNVTSTTTITFPVILEGKIYTSILDEFQLNEAWLMKQLAAQGIYEKQDVFIATINKKRELQISLYNEKSRINIPKLYH